MSASTAAMPSSTTATTPSSLNTSVFWEGQWRASGIVFVALAIVAYVVYGSQPQVGAPADAVLAFYIGDRARILIAAVFAGLAVIYLLWFVAALRTALAEAGQDGWGAAATASSAAVAGLFFALITVDAALAYSIASPGNQSLASGLNNFAWAGVVLTSFPRAMLTMSAAFGLWRARLISNGLFAVGVAAVVLTLLGGTTWITGGFWAPDGAYSRFITPFIGVAWVLVVSRILLTRIPATRASW